MLRRHRWLVLAALAASMLSRIDFALTAQTRALALTVLSSRADMVTGGDALLELTGAGSSPQAVTVMVEGRDVTRAFAPDNARGSLTGLVDGLSIGPNVIEVRAGAQRTRLTLTNFAVTGPVFSGPHLEPFVCRTVESGLGEALDRNCSAATRIDYFYRSTRPVAADGDPAGRPAYERWPQDGEPPDDVAHTTTTDGRTVPYVVRVESGTINRAIYRIAILDDPTATGTARWRPGPGWNGRLMYSFGGGCGTNYDQGTNLLASALDDAALSRGFAFAISTQNVMGQHCNDALSGEALMMVKERFIERYGVPVWTVGRGGSGGAIQQLLIAQNYPGLLDGILPSLTFPDSISIRSGVADCRLLLSYYRAHPEALTETERSGVEGSTPGTCAAWDRGLVNVIVADYAEGCGIPAEMVYHPVNNPKGARCTLWDTNVATFGRDPRTGFARRTYDNVGLQYGLKALSDSVITPEQFLDLNERIGGFNDDGHVRAERSEADAEAVRLAYAAGRLDSGDGGLGRIPILHYRSYNDPLGDIHDRFRDFSVRERLRKSHSRTDNQVIWTSPTRNAAVSAVVSSQALDTMSEWLDSIVKDTSSRPAIEKIVRAKPARAVDACWDDTGKRINEEASFAGKNRCNELFPSHMNPRLVAGAPLADDVLKCQLKPVAAGDYKVKLTADQMDRLRRIFPTGVCDYSRPGVNHVRLAGTFLRLPLVAPRPSTSAAS